MRKIGYSKIDNVGESKEIFVEIHKEGKYVGEIYYVKNGETYFRIFKSQINLKQVAMESIT